MKLLYVRNSLEQCQEAGWVAYDYFLDEPIDNEFIYKFKSLGSFVYLSFLKEPFFKAENHFFIIKGVKGHKHFRIAIHREHEDLLNMIQQTIGI